MIPWNQELKEPEIRYLYGNFPEFEGIKYLRDNELQNPAPFSHRTFIELKGCPPFRYQCPVDFERYRTAVSVTYKMDVPIVQIIGAATTNNMHNTKQDKTYREILFTCLHGAGVYMDALEFLASRHCKDQPMPHTIINKDPKTRSVLALELTRYGEFFFTANGHQRTVFAMYYIWQTEGINGLLKNVTVSELFPLPQQASKPIFGDIAP